MKYKKLANGCYYIDKKVYGHRCQLRAWSVAELDKKYNDWIKETVLNEKAGQWFVDVGDEWLRDCESRVEITTMQSYASRYKDIREEFKSCRINEIDTADVSRYLKKMEKDGKAKKTISNAKIVISQIFEYYSDKNRCYVNPARYAKIPKSASTTKRLPPNDAVVEKVRDNQNLLAHILMYTGMRLGEANGLQKKDIHFDDVLYGVKGYIDINKKVVWVNNSPVVQNFTKTESGIRRVPIFKPLREYLYECVSDIGDDDYVVSGSCRPLTNKEYQCRWANYCKSIDEYVSKKVKYKTVNGIDYYRNEIKGTITPHQFRHYLATIMYESGINELTAAKIFGHKSPSTMHKIYVAIREKKMEESVVAIENHFL